MLSLAIMAVPERRALVLATYNKLKAEGVGDRVQLVFDRDREGCWPTARRAWSAYHSEATHHVVIQDDVLICREFFSTMEYILLLLPLGAVFSPYCTYKACDGVLAQDKHWGILRYGIWGVGSCWPIDLVRDMLEWTENHCRVTLDWDDYRLIGYLHAVNRPEVWVSVPSLIQHGGSSSILPGHGGIREARHFIGEQVSGLSIDWMKGLSEPLRLGSAASPKMIVEEWKCR